MKGFLLILLSIFLMSCGPKPRKTQFVLKLSALTTSAFQGGVLLLGRNMKNGETFQEGIDSTVFTRELSDGEWQFVAYAWDGPVHFNGTLYCSKVIKQLVNAETKAVDIFVGDVNCMNTGNYFDPGGIDTFSDPNQPYNAAFRVCNANEIQSALDSGFCSYSGMATGMTLTAPSFLNLKPTAFPLRTSCLKISSGSHYSPMKIPMLPPDFVNPKWQIELFYSSAGSTCTGDECCKGRVETIKVGEGFSNPLPNGALSAYYANFGNTYLFNEPAVKDKLAFAPLTSVSYNACNAVQVDYHSLGSPASSPKGFSYTPSCTSNCQFFADNSCTVASNNFFFPAGDSSHTFYMKVNSGQSFSLTQGGDDATIGGDIRANIAVTASYLDIDSDFLWNATNIGTYGLSSVNAATIQPGVWIVYQTQDGNRGKMYINNRYTTTTANDTMDFDFITWDSGGAIVAQGTGITSTQCSTFGDCFIDLDINAGKLSPSNIPGQSDAWWGGNGAIVQFSPQSSTFRKMGP